MANLKVPVSKQDHSQGKENTPITLVEYGDYQCPYCGKAYPIIKKIQNHYGSQLRFVFRNFPLTEIHPLAESAAESAEFASTQGLFWEMHDLIFENQSLLSLETLIELGQSLQLSPFDLQDTIESHTFEDTIQRDFMSGVRSGVNGTPTFFINGIHHNGRFDFETLVASIDEKVQSAKK